MKAGVSLLWANEAPMGQPVGSTRRIDSCEGISDTGGFLFGAQNEQDEMPGYIALERDPIDNLEDRLATSIPGACTTVLLKMIFLANYEPKMFKGVIVGRGDVCVSVSTLQKRTGLGTKTIRNALEVLKATKSITQKGAIKGANKATLYHIDIYDDIIHKFDEGANEGANRGQTGGKQGATSKELKEVKKEKEVQSFDSSGSKDPSESCQKLSAQIEEIGQHYNAKISPKAGLIDTAKDKIKVRLKTYTLATLLEAIDRFSADPWRMEHNAKEGMTWFFRSNEQIEKFLALGDSFKAKDETGKKKFTCPTCGADGIDMHNGSILCPRDVEHMWVDNDSEEILCQKCGDYCVMDIDDRKIKCQNTKCGVPPSDPNEIIGITPSGKQITRGEREERHKARAGTI